MTPFMEKFQKIHTVTGSMSVVAWEWEGQEGLSKGTRRLFGA